MGSCSRVKGFHGDSAVETEMVRLVKRKRKVRECKRVKGGMTKRRWEEEVG